MPPALRALVGESKDSHDAGPRDPREVYTRIATAYLRKELTDLEQYVLIQIFDQAWKDHLYAMDMLKSGIGLQAFAEQDPRVLYKKEGFEFFQQMLSGIRDKVTDLIFRARVQGQTPARATTAKRPPRTKRPAATASARTCSPAPAPPTASPRYPAGKTAPSPRPRSSAKPTKSAATTCAPAAAERSTRSAAAQRQRDRTAFKSRPGIK